jgi:hypothetical protein
MACYLYAAMLFPSLQGNLDQSKFLGFYDTAVGFRGGWRIPLETLACYTVMR